MDMALALAFNILPAHDFMSLGPSSMLCHREEHALLVLVCSPDLPPCGPCLMGMATGRTKEEVWKDSRCWWFHRAWVALWDVGINKRHYHNEAE